MFLMGSLREDIEADIHDVAASLCAGCRIYFYWVTFGNEDIDSTNTGIFLESAMYHDRMGTVKILRHMYVYGSESFERGITDGIWGNRITLEHYRQAIRILVKGLKINELYWEMEGWPIPRVPWCSPGMSKNFTPHAKQGVLFE